MGDGGGGHWLVQTEWRPAGWSVCLPLLIFPFTIKSRSSLLATAHPDGPGKRAVKRLWCGDKATFCCSVYIFKFLLVCDFTIYSEAVVHDEDGRFIAFCQRAPDK